MDAFDVWKYVAPYDKDTDYIRFFAHRTLHEEIERASLCVNVNLLSGIRANLATNTANLYAIHNLLNTSVELLEKNPMLYRTKPQKTVYEVKDGIEISVNDRKYTAKCEYIKNFVPNTLFDLPLEDLYRGQWWDLRGVWRRFTTWVEYLAYKIADCQNWIETRVAFMRFRAQNITRSNGFRSLWRIL